MQSKTMQSKAMQGFKLTLDIPSENSNDVIQSPVRSPFTALSTTAFNRFSTCPRTSGEIRVGKQLGRGSFGKVELITIHDDHTDLDDDLHALIEPYVDELYSEDFARKSVLFEDSQISLEQGIEEVLIHKKISLSSDCVPIFHSVDEADSKHLSWVIEKCNGDLKDFIHKGGYIKKVEEDDFTWNDVRDCLKQLCQAMAQVHEHGECAHLDLKPANVMYRMTDGKPQYLISDFSFETFKIFDDDMNVRPNQFTLQYASPEMVQYMVRKNQDPTTTPINGPKADTWMIGTTILTMCTGTIPRLGGAPQLHLYGGGRPEIPEAIPEDIKTFLNLCFADVEERPTPLDFANRFVDLIET